jgi:hypothetical protein
MRNLQLRHLVAVVAAAVMVGAAVGGVSGYATDATPMAPAPPAANQQQSGDGTEHDDWD